MLTAETGETLRATGLLKEVLKCNSVFLINTIGHVKDTRNAMSYLLICFTEEETTTTSKKTIEYINQLLVHCIRSFIFCIVFIYFIFLCFCCFVCLFFPLSPGLSVVL